MSEGNSQTAVAMSAQSSPDGSGHSHIMQLPPELFLEIFRLVRNDEIACEPQGDAVMSMYKTSQGIRDIRLVCRRFRDNSSELLFKAITVEPTSRSLCALENIASHPLFSKHTTSIRVLTPRYARYRGDSADSDEEALADLVSDLVSAAYVESQRFTWMLDNFRGIDTGRYIATPPAPLVSLAKTAHEMEDQLCEAIDFYNFGSGHKNSVWRALEDATRVPAAMDVPATNTRSRGLLLPIARDAVFRGEDQHEVLGQDGRRFLDRVATAIASLKKVHTVAVADNLFKGLHPHPRSKGCLNDFIASLPSGIPDEQVAGQKLHQRMLRRLSIGYRVTQGDDQLLGRLPLALDKAGVLGRVKALDVSKLYYGRSSLNHMRFFHPLIDWQEGVSPEVLAIQAFAGGLETLNLAIPSGPLGKAFAFLHNFLEFFLGDRRKIRHCTLAFTMASRSRSDPLDMPPERDSSPALEAAGLLPNIESGTWQKLEIFTLKKSQLDINVLQTLLEQMRDLARARSGTDRPNVTLSLSKLKITGIGYVLSTDRQWTFWGRVSGLFEEYASSWSGSLVEGDTAKMVDADLVFDRDDVSEVGFDGNGEPWGPYRWCPPI